MKYQGKVRYRTFQLRGGRDAGGLDAGGLDAGGRDEVGGDEGGGDEEGRGEGLSAVPEGVFVCRAGSISKRISGRILIPPRAEGHICANGYSVSSAYVSSSKSIMRVLFPGQAGPREAPLL